MIDISFERINSIKNHPLYILSKTENERILTHDAIIKLVKLKWEARPRLFYWTNLVLYLLFISLLTTEIIYAEKFDEYLFDKSKMENFNETNFLDFEKF